MFKKNPPKFSSYQRPHFSNGPTSRTTIGQFSRMNIHEQFESLIQNAVQEKDKEIKTLKEQIDKLREENEKLSKQIGHGGHGDIKNKAETLKKALDDFLEHPNSNRHPTFSSRLQQASHIPPSVSIPNSNIDVKPSTSTRPDELSVNSQRFNPNRNFNSHNSHNSHEDFSANPDHHFHPSHNSHLQTTLPTTYNVQKRFQNGYPNGMNNNNNNRNNRNNNNNNMGPKYTIFVSWPGSATKEQLQELFESEDIDVADIRYTAQKQFAHVDLKTELAQTKAISLNGVTKNEKQGTLRVEVGKPRSSNPNPTENGQRPQNQNKNYTRPNNKNPNGYNNTSLPQKQNKYPNYNPNHNNYNNHNNHNNHNHNGGFPPSFVPADSEKDTNNNLSWQNIEVAKQQESS
ncbi:unnamed protein product [Rhizophagus irregularis]|uniref:RRM domain-containing protein n=2 Tax=Rhizophagus irregularis TaxID=588596 RepID=A0A915Z9S4_9GLOM|nr:hypothetical protein GLOIN_2v1883856 [Rhizophagus irregularis DAOM 181602=DAOM 197198]CAB5366050.1 unnamed protein product [Rhizophagus irregularis]